MQLLPQLPQLTLSEFRFVSHPSRLMFSLELQSPQPDPQLAILHWLPEHVGVPCVALHAALHPPQLAVLLAVLVSQPSRLTFSSALQFA